MKSQIQKQLALIPFLFGLLLAACMSTAALAQTQIGADIDGEAADDRFGFSVSLSADGNRLAIGALRNDGNGEDSGQVRVFQWNGLSWLQLGADIDGEAAGDRSGSPVSLSSDGERLAIGAGYNDGNGVDSGHVRVYRWTDSEWSQLGADIDGEAADDRCGNVSLSGDGNRLAIGAHGNDGNGDHSGHVRVFQWSSIAWEQLGASIEGEAAGDLSGYRVSLSADGNRLAIGAHRNGGNGEDSGQVRVFQWNGSSWLQLGADIDGESAGGNFGYSVSLSAEGGRLAAGAWNNSPGYVGVWDWTGTDWLQVGDNIYGKAEGGNFGTSVALSAGGNRLAIGAGGNSDSGYYASGQVQVYQWSGGVWTQLGNNINGIAEWDFLDAVAISSDGNTLAAGASEGGPNGTGAGRASVYDFSMFNAFKINAGLNDAWYFLDTSGQGFFITVFPDLGYVSLAWFTYDTELSPLDATANLGDPGHRWLTAVGPIDGNQALMDIEMTSGGIFDTPSIITRTDPPGSDGTILLTFDSCSTGTIEYDIPSINRQGIVPIQRVANDNIVICEALNGGQ